MKKLLYLSMFLWLVLTGCTQEKKEFTVLQWNIWQEGTMVPGGYEAIVCLLYTSPSPRDTR
mgnify:CR=1 FL=1